MSYIVLVVCVASLSVATRLAAASAAGDKFDPITTLYCTDKNGFAAKDAAKICVVNDCIEMDLYPGYECVAGDNGTTPWADIGGGKEVMYYKYKWLPDNGSFRIAATRCKDPAESPDATGKCQPVNHEKTQPCEEPPACSSSKKPKSKPPTAGNPINLLTGNKYQVESDYNGVGPFPLRFQRYYNSQLLAIDTGDLSGHWRHSYQRAVVVLDRHGDGVEAALVVRQNGRTVEFSDGGTGTWTSDPDVVERLVELVDTGGARTGWQLTTAADAIEQYDVAGRLLSIMNREGWTQTLSYSGDDLTQVIDPFGRTLTFTYDPTSGVLATMTAPGGEVYSFEHDATTGLLTAVVYPDATPADPNDNPRREYHYEDVAHPGALTRLVNENGVDFATWTYDAYGRAITSQHAGGVEAVAVDYDTPPGSVTVTDALSNVRVVAVDAAHGTGFASSSAGGPCVSCGLTHASQTRDANGFVDSAVDFNGNTNSYAHDADGLETSRTEAVGTSAERTITTTWHATYRRPTLIARAGQTVAFTYNADGQVLTRTVTDTATSRTRTTTRTYTDGATSGVPKGLLASIDGPRTDVSDVTTYGYYADGSGSLHTVTNALSQTTTFTHYDAHGRATRWVDPNGLVTEVNYDARGRVTETQVDGKATTITYDAASNPTRVTRPDASYLDYTYDTANRLTRITDALGTYVEFTLDDAGNRIDISVYDPAGGLNQARAQVFDTLGRLVYAIGGEGQTVGLEYDASGNLTAFADGKNQQSSSGYDALDRLVSSSAPDAGTTQLAYDARNNLTAVTDARGEVTSYGYNGLDDLESLLSPDTGSTSYTTDDAGNQVTRVDARGVTTTYVYDALNRLAAKQYPDASENVAYFYDSASSGVGRLASVTDPSGTTTYAYDARGNVTSETRTITGASYVTSYRYDDADRLAGITYPSGIDVDYVRDAVGQVTAVTMTDAGVTTTLASGISYRPLGPVNALTFGNGVTETRTFDDDGRLTDQISTGIVERAYGYDDNDNIVTLTNILDLSRDQSFSYDAADRLTQAQGLYGTRSYEFDVIGGRERIVVDSPAFPFNTPFEAPPPRGLSYNDAGRLESITIDGSLAGTYRYNAFEQRAEKVAGGVTTRFVYLSNGALLSEDDGTTLREYVYLGERLLAVLATDAGGTNVHYVHTDHLNTPQSVSDGAGTLVWRADYAPFGDAIPDTDPDGDGSHYYLNARFPGQYLDAESGLHYNYHRYYDPSTGRYLKSDPIGLAGALNTYGYAQSNPILGTDPAGLSPIVGTGTASRGPKGSPITRPGDPLRGGGRPVVVAPGNQGTSGTGLPKPGTPGGAISGPFTPKPTIGEVVGNMIGQQVIKRAISAATGLPAAVIATGSRISSGAGLMLHSPALGSCVGDPDCEARPYLPPGLANCVL